MIKIEPGETPNACLDRNSIPTLLDWDVQITTFFMNYTKLSTKTTIKLYRLSPDSTMLRLIRGTNLVEYLK